MQFRTFVGSLRFPLHYPKMNHLVFNRLCHEDLIKSGYNPIDFETRSIEVCKSTNDEVNKHLKSYDNCIVLSMIQEKGRGRDGKTWDSPIGGVWMSLGMNIKSEVIELSTIVIKSVSKVLNSYVNCIIKEPNDIFVNDKKLCGVLVETKSSGSIFEQIVIGIGINVFNEIHEDLIEIATRLKDHCDPPSIPELASKIIVEVINNVSKSLIN